MKFFLKFDNYKLIKENAEEAKKILTEKGINPEDPNFLTLKNDILKNNPGFLGVFTKFLFIDNRTIDELRKTFTWIQMNRQALKDLSKPVIQFETYESLTDEIEQIETVQSVKNIVQQFPHNIRTNWNKQDLPSRYQQAILIKELIKTDTVKDFLKKSSRYNNSPLEQFVEYLKNFVDRNSSGLTFENVVKIIKETPGASITYKNEESGVVAASIKTYEASSKLGSQSWCISYKNNSSYFNVQYMSPEKFNTQYFVWCTELPVSNSLSMVAATVNPKGQIINIHDKFDANIKQHINVFFEASGLNENDFQPLNAKALQDIKNTITHADVKDMESFLVEYDKLSKEYDTTTLINSFKYDINDSYMDVLLHENLSNLSLSEFDNFMKSIEDNYVGLSEIIKSKIVFNKFTNVIYTKNLSDVLEFLETCKSYTIKDTVISNYRSSDGLPKLNTKSEVQEYLNKWPSLIDLIKKNEHVGKDILVKLIVNLSYGECYEFLYSDESIFKGMLTGKEFNTKILSIKINNVKDINEYAEWYNTKNESSFNVDDLFEVVNLKNNKTYIEQRIKMDISDNYINLLSDDIKKLFVELPIFILILNEESLRYSVFTNSDLSLDTILNIVNSDKRIDQLTNKDFKVLIKKVENVEDYYKVFNYLKTTADGDDLYRFVDVFTNAIDVLDTKTSIDILKKLKSDIDLDSDKLEESLGEFIDSLFVYSVEPGNTEIFFDYLSENKEYVSDIDIEWCIENIGIGKQHAQKAISDLIEHFDVPNLKSATLTYGLSFINNGRYSDVFIEEASRHHCYKEGDEIMFIYDDFHDPELGCFYSDDEPIEEDYLDRFYNNSVSSWDDYSYEISKSNVELIESILKSNGYNLDTYSYKHILDGDGDDEEDEDGNTIESNPNDSSMHEEIANIISQVGDDGLNSANGDAYFEQVTGKLMRYFFTNGFDWIEDEVDGKTKHLLRLKMPIADIKRYFKGGIEELINYSNEASFKDIMECYMRENSSERIDKPNDVDASIDTEDFNANLESNLKHI